MSELAIGFIGIGALLLLLLMRIPVAFSLFAVGMVGISYLHWNPNAPYNILAQWTWDLSTRFELIVIPLFILMGNVATESGMSRRLYDAAYAVIGSIRGGLASATILGCGGFAAICGSSVAAALTMGRVSLGEMERFRYHPSLATGTVAAGGTLGILIPPSTGFVVYAILTQQSIGRLFLAGVIPGILLLLLFIMVITVVAVWREEYAPRGPRVSWSEKSRAMMGALPIIAIVIITVGGIYRGVFSPLQASAIGAALVILYNVVTRDLNVSKFLRAVRDTVKTTATVMLILIAAHVFNPFMSLSGLPHTVGEFLTGLDVSPMSILILILLCYLILGLFLEGFAMMVLTLPVFFPVITGLGFDPIWFGVLVVVTLEMGLITPPVGINVFVVKSIVPHVPLKDIFVGIVPFWIAMIILVILLLIWPNLALYLPNTMIT